MMTWVSVCSTKVVQQNVALVGKYFPAMPQQNDSNGMLQHFSTSITRMTIHF